MAFLLRDSPLVVVVSVGGGRPGGEVRPVDPVALSGVVARIAGPRRVGDAVANMHVTVITTSETTFWKKHNLKGVEEKGGKCRCLVFTMGDIILAQSPDLRTSP